MSLSLRPGIYSSYEIRSSVIGSGRAALIGLAAAVTVQSAEAAEIQSLSEAAARFGADSSMAKLTRVLLLNGASKIFAVPVTDGDYASAFERLMAEPGVAFMICDSRQLSVFGAMISAMEDAGEASKYRLGIVEMGGTAVQLTSAATAINNERLVICGNCEPAGGAAGSVAAAVAAAAASCTDPAIPLNGVQLKGLSGLAYSFSDEDTEELISMGVTPVETAAGETCIVRAVTTRTMTDGQADASLRELNTMLVIDDVIPAVRSSLKEHFSRCRNNASSRAAIRTQVIVVLEEKLRRGTIESYGDVTVRADESDPTVCLVSFGFAVAHGLSSICLEVCITV